MFSHGARPGQRGITNNRTVCLRIFTLYCQLLCDLLVDEAIQLQRSSITRWARLHPASSLLRLTRPRDRTKLIDNGLSESAALEFQWRVAHVIDKYRGQIEADDRRNLNTLRRAFTVRKHLLPWPQMLREGRTRRLRVTCVGGPGVTMLRGFSAWLSRLPECLLRSDATRRASPHSSPRTKNAPHWQDHHTRARAMREDSGVRGPF